MPTTPSPLRYPGGKAKFYLYVRGILEQNNLLGETYIEPFAGGAGLAIKLLLNNDVKQIVINDFDYAIYSFWYSVLHHTKRLCEMIEHTDITPHEWHRQKEVYLNQESRDIFEVGFATFFLNRTNVSGIIKGGLIGGSAQNGAYTMTARFNKTGLINKIQAIAARRDQIVLTNLDAQELITPLNLEKFQRSLINFDPPYVKKGHQLYKNSFNDKDHENLRNKISNLNNQHWIVTYDICSLVTELYKDYRWSYLDVTYSVKVNKKAQEYIFFSNNLILPQYVQS